jgi:hypothetical protein
MEKKTTGIIATIATALLCGCPGLFGLCYGALTALVSFIPGADINMFGRTDPQAALYYGIGALCLGLIFVAIPIVVGVLTLRKKPEAMATVTMPEEPLPPPS